MKQLFGCLSHLSSTLHPGLPQKHNSSRSKRAVRVSILSRSIESDFHPKTPFDQNNFPNMALDVRHQSEKLDKTLQQTPGIQIFLQPIAPPAALGLAGFAGSTWITSSYIANWWGGPESPTIFFPFVGLFGGLAQFIAGLYGFKARDTLVTVINTMWGSFWISIGILYAFVVSFAFLSKI
jgi:hypothetical protein